jgi:hypothetical protein
MGRKVGDRKKPTVTKRDLDNIAMRSTFGLLYNKRKGKSTKVIGDFVYVYYDRAHSQM